MTNTAQWGVIVGNLSSTRMRVYLADLWSVCKRAGNAVVQAAVAQRLRHVDLRHAQEQLGTYALAARVGRDYCSAQFEAIEREESRISQMRITVGLPQHATITDRAKRGARTVINLAKAEVLCYRRKSLVAGLGNALSSLDLEDQSATQLAARIREVRSRIEDLEQSASHIIHNGIQRLRLYRLAVTVACGVFGVLCLSIILFAIQSHGGKPITSANREAKGPFHESQSAVQELAADLNAILRNRMDGDSPHQFELLDAKTGRYVLWNPLTPSYSGFLGDLAPQDASLEQRGNNYTLWIPIKRESAFVRNLGIGISFTDKRKALLQERLEKAEIDGRILGMRGLAISRIQERFAADTLRILRDLCAAYDKGGQRAFAGSSEAEIAATIAAALDRVPGSKTVVSIEKADKEIRIQRRIDARPGFSEFKWNAHFSFDDIRAARVRPLFANQTAFGISHRHVVIPARRTDHRFHVSTTQGSRTEESDVPALILQIDSEKDGLEIRSAILALCENWGIDPDPP